ncbi:MAG: hypothetical protein EYC70_11955 [Planctomycetota bacterium]|nr:MAG: hypothetical protein EYC70_11955 [Planctomycetota bacterium]
MDPRRTVRPVEPVAEEPQPEAAFEPRRGARTLAALLLHVGPLLAVLGLLGWLRLVAGVPQPFPAAADASALLQDFLLLLLFLVPHSLFARGFGRRWLNMPLGPAGERPLYVLHTGVSLCLLALLWRQSGPLLWNLEGVLVVLARLVQVAGLLLAGWATVAAGIGGMLGVSDLSALRRGQEPPNPEFMALPPYKYVRHPVNLGNLLLLLGMPEVTLDRLLMLVVLGLWLLLSAAWEERDSEMTFGDAYRAYKQRTPRWIPRLRAEEAR